MLDVFHFICNEYVSNTSPGKYLIVDIVPGAGNPISLSPSVGAINNACPFKDLYNQERQLRCKSCFFPFLYRAIPVLLYCVFLLCVSPVDSHMIHFPIKLSRKGDTATSHRACLHVPAFPILSIFMFLYSFHLIVAWVRASPVGFGTWGSCIKESRKLLFCTPWSFYPLSWERLWVPSEGLSQGTLAFLMNLLNQCYKHKLLARFLIVIFAFRLLKFLPTGISRWDCLGPFNVGGPVGVSLTHPTFGSVVLRPLF